MHHIVLLRVHQRVISGSASRVELSLELLRKRSLTGSGLARFDSWENVGFMSNTSSFGDITKLNAFSSEGTPIGRFMEIHLEYEVVSRSCRWVIEVPYLRGLRFAFKI